VTAVLSYLLSHGGIVFMRLLGVLPLPVVRALGWLLGWVLHALARSRRRVVLINATLPRKSISSVSPKPGLIAAGFGTARPG
jgi:Kdo2-lipid IVA lauroyltransferase/acyltransferase